MSIDRVLNKGHFYGKIIQKMCSKSYPQTPFFILGNNPKQPLHERNSKILIFFLSNLVPFKGESYQKQKGPETSDQPLFRLRKKVTKISLLVIYYLTKFDGVL